MLQNILASQSCPNRLGLGVFAQRGSVWVFCWVSLAHYVRFRWPRPGSVPFLFLETGWLYFLPSDLAEEYVSNEMKWLWKKRKKIHRHIKRQVLQLQNRTWSARERKTKPTQSQKARDDPNPLAWSSMLPMQPRRWTPANGYCSFRGCHRPGKPKQKMKESESNKMARTSRDCKILQKYFPVPWALLSCFISPFSQKS